MHDHSDRWDVFVVGVRDGTHASTVALAAEVSHYTGLPTSEVELALMKGEVRVRAALDREDAEGAALELDDFGAVVDLRLADGKSGLLEILKPDASRSSGVMVGGFIDDSATPPALSEISGMLKLEPIADGLPPPPPMGAPLETLEDVSSRLRIGARSQFGSVDGRGSPEHDAFGEAARRLASADASSLGHIDDHDGGDKAIVDVPIPRTPDSVRPVFSRASAAPSWINDTPVPGGGEPTAPPAAPPFGQQAVPVAASRIQPRVPTFAPPPRAVTPTPTPVPQHAASLLPEVTAAAADSASMLRGLELAELSDLPGPPAAKKKKKKRTGETPRRDTSVPPTATAEAVGNFDPSASASIELDFEKAGILPKKRRLKELGGHISGAHEAVPGLQPPRRTRVDDVVGTGRRAMPGAESGERGFLLGVDASTAIPAGLGLGLLMSMVIAIQLQRSAVTDVLTPLEQELLAATTNPAGAGKDGVREASQVEADLNATYESLRRSFVLKWLAIGVPLGLLLSRIPRVGE